MYCVKCGVRLQDGETECPLCGTKVMIDTDTDMKPHIKYSNMYPSENTNGKYISIGFVTAVMICACLVCLIVCLKTYGEVSWSGYVMLGIALTWVVLVFPYVFKRWIPMLFIPIDFAALCGYLLYICLYNRQSWFLSFAFPVTMILCAFTMTAVALYSHVKRGRLYITGGLLLALGASFMLIEFFQHITFGSQMFVWSLYCVCGFGAIGVFLLIAAMIPPLRDYLERKFFI